jgi:hypothetical protein
MNYIKTLGQGYFDQKEAGPCHIFATVAAVEAMSQIYFNKNAQLDLSESNLYNLAHGGISPLQVKESLDTIMAYGLVNQICLRYPYYANEMCENCGYRYPDLDGLCEEPEQLVFIPGYSQIAPQNDTQLMQAIMDHGPIIVTMDTVGVALYGSGQKIDHTVLVIGWESNPTFKWRIKDSWMYAPSNLWNTPLDIIDYAKYFYYVKPRNDSIISSHGSNNSLFESRECNDNDKDGFYNWGLATEPKPVTCSGPDLMDFNDDDHDVLFLNGYTPITVVPNITSTGLPICSGSVITLNDVPSIMDDSVTWALTPTNYFSSTNGNGHTATIYPTSSNIGKKCTITFTLRYRGEIKYSMDFYPNGPHEDQVSISVLDSNGEPAQGSDDFFYLCPNTNYTVYYNNSDYSCTTSSFSWTLPYGWTKNYEYSNYVSINTNDYPNGYLQIYANTCCSSNINVKNVYFGEAYCGEYFVIFPNPSNNSVEINTLKSKSSKEGYGIDPFSIEDKCLLTLFDKSGMIRSKIEFKGFPYTLDTSKLHDGLYFLNLSLGSKKSTFRLVVKH